MLTQNPAGAERSCVCIEATAGPEHLRDKAFHLAVTQGGVAIAHRIPSLHMVNLQVGVFSATLPPDALEITRKFMNKPVSREGRWVLGKLQAELKGQR